MWEEVPEFKPWLAKSNDSKYLAYCKLCCLPLKASSGKNDIKKQQNSESHQAHLKSVTMQKSVGKCFEDYTGIKRQVIKAEIQNAALICEHNLPFSLADHLILMEKSSFSDSKIADRISCSRTKATGIVKNVLGTQQQENLTNILKKNRFSLCIDESTDLSTTKLLSLVVRVCVDFEVRDYFMALKKVIAAEAVTLYTAITDHFKDLEINYKHNLIGFAADGANNVTGQHNSVAALLKKDCNNLVVLKCVCHSFALCSSYACLKIPSSVESTIRDIYNYISNSPKELTNLSKCLFYWKLSQKKFCILPKQDGYLWNVLSKEFLNYTSLLPFFLHSKPI